MKNLKTIFAVLAVMTIFGSAAAFADNTATGQGNVPCTGGATNGNPPPAPATGGGGNGNPSSGNGGIPAPSH